ncbi:MAG: trypsin-like peptidase domain-containing protein [Atopobiaceae bacterium]|nr:trypsin-like peptidase domain-containing protein [Atopobiaceae bacterium]
MFGGLTFTGHLDAVTPLVQGQATTAATTQDQSSESDMSSAGPTISIDATNATADIAQVVAKKALPSVVSIYVTTSQGSGVGSGVIIDANGNVLTNYHVVEGAQDITVTIGDNNYVGKVVGSDESSDLAVVHVDTEGVEVTPIEAGDSDALVVGDWVMAIGSPYGLDQSVSTGIVSSLYRSTMLPSTSGRTIYTNLIQTDATINPGNSGGALVNSKGQLVGINSIIQSTTGSSIGLGFAIPSNYAVEVAREIIAGEMVLHPYIGLSLQTVTAQNAHLHNLPVNQGAFVAAVIEGGPAEAAGIQQGDIIIKVGRDNITSADALILAVRSHKIGETVSVTLMRGTEQVTLDVTLASDEPLQQASGDYGLSGQDNGGGEGYGNNSNGG